ncbi:DUF4262 domain-containing protein [Pararhizobium sp. BT-229]|uniref:DUF4262 domain-containing protein n=1 Tax=Pararhizobium sp. BT-229 TaxID=2986923 RepID=UPI0021F7920C|nr:DUF4262 domain-containing protein [Pararhizobium sp. BT-229]MCV9964195.1 DUF4262 domain-containing protein [Pararhizobium sp. BT-229]
MHPALKRDVRNNILLAGQHIQAVFPRVGGTGDTFFYTIGNAERGLPELLLIGGFRPEIAMHMLNEIAQYMRERGKAPEEGFLDIGWTLPFKVRKAGGNVRTEYTAQAGEYLGHERYEVIQVMICDGEGRYPGDDGCQFEVPRP